MKKKSQKTAIIAACITVILLIAGAILIFANQNSYGTMEGLYLKADNGTSLIIDGTSPIQMSDVKNRNLFEGLTDGDRIRIKHDAVLETFPGRTGAYRVTKLADGDRIDIPQEVIDALTDLMWLAAPLDPESAGNMAADMVFDTRLSYVGWTDQDTPWQMAINMSDRLLSSEKALPLMLVNDTFSLSSLKNSLGEVLSMDGSYDEVGSFNEATAGCDDAFFADSTLMVVYIEAPSGSYRYGLDNIYCDGKTFQITVKKTVDPEVHTDDMAGWFLSVAVPKTMVAPCTYLKAVMA